MAPSLAHLLENATAGWRATGRRVRPENGKRPSRERAFGNRSEAPRVERALTRVPFQPERARRENAAIEPVAAESDTALHVALPRIEGRAEDHDIALAYRPAWQHTEARSGVHEAIHQHLIPGFERRDHRVGRNGDHLEQKGAHEERQEEGDDRRPRQRENAGCRAIGTSAAGAAGQRGRWNERVQRVLVRNPRAVLASSRNFAPAPRHVPSEVPPPNDQ